EATLYFHYPCFDGLVSGVLASQFLETAKAWHIERFCPVNYESRATWISTPLDRSAAIVDFLYHPQASFWSDHHSTTFVSPHAKKDYEQRSGAVTCLLFDETARSCARLLWNHLNSSIPDAERYRDMVAWAD